MTSRRAGTSFRGALIIERHFPLAEPRRTFQEIERVRGMDIVAVEATSAFVTDHVDIVQVT